MSDKSELKAELERKKQRIAQIREEKKRKEEEKKKKDVCGRNNNCTTFKFNYISQEPVCFVLARWFSVAVYCDTLSYWS